MMHRFIRSCLLLPTASRPEQQRNSNGTVAAVSAVEKFPASAGAEARSKLRSWCGLQGFPRGCLGAEEPTVPGAPFASSRAPLQLELSCQDAQSQLPTWAAGEGRSAHPKLCAGAATGTLPKACLGTPETASSCLGGSSSGCPTGSSQGETSESSPRGRCCRRRRLSVVAVQRVAGWNMAGAQLLLKPFLLKRFCSRPRQRCWPGEVVSAYVCAVTEKN